MNRELSRSVRERAYHRCEYCLLPESLFPLPFQIDHVRAEKHGGETIKNNLASQTVRLFTPRADIWEQHFEVDGDQLRWKTAIGRVTVAVLEMNSTDQLLVRSALSKEGWPEPNK